MEENKIKRLIVNLDGWYVPRSSRGPMTKGTVLDLDSIDNEYFKNRILAAYNNKEIGYCRKEKKNVLVVIKSMTRQDIIDDTLEEVSEKFVTMAKDKLSQDDIIGFRDELRKIAEKKTAENNAKTSTKKPLKKTKVKTKKKITKEVSV